MSAKLLPDALGYWCSFELQPDDRSYKVIVAGSRALATSADLMILVPITEVLNFLLTRKFMMIFRPSIG